MTEERKVQIGVEVATTEARAGFQELRADAQNMAEGVARSGAQASTAIDGIGAGASSSAARVDGASRNLIAAIQRTTAAMEAGSRSGAQYYEVLAAQRGVDVNVLRPYLAQLEEVTARQRAAAAATEENRSAIERATEAARAEAQAQREVAQAQAGRESFLGSLREQIALYGRSADEVLRYRAAQAGAAESAAPLILQLQNVRAAHEQITEAARAEAAAQREALQVQSGQNSFLASLEQQATAIGRTRSELLELQAAQMGVTTQAAPFIARLREAEGAVARTGVSAAQTAAALRGVPAQFTDIVTSIQGGQAPLTVFLQQGGQLRDMFGSAGGAARALAGYVASLINPFTIAAGAAVALAVAYHQGSQEADAYAHALILTGNAAGTTSNQLADMARKISGTVGTQGAAAEALAALAGTGKVSVANLQRFGTVAVEAQRTIGKSVADTAKDFDDLGKSPLQASAKLNEQYRYLTGAVYAQIKALEEQGRQQEAANVAQTAYADGSAALSARLMATLPPVEKAWLGIKDAAKGAWDTMLNVGREDTLEQQLQKVQESLRKMRDAQQLGQKSMFGAGNVGFDSAAADSNSVKNALAREESLKRQIDAQSRLAAIEQGKAQLNAADLQWAQDSEKYLERKDQLARDLAANLAKGTAAGASDKAINDRALQIRKSYSDIYNAGIDSQIEAIKRRGAAEDSVAKRSLDLLTSNRAAGLVREEDYITAVAQLEQAAFEKEKSRLQEELRLTTGKQNSQKEQAALRGQIAQIDIDIDSRRLKTGNELFELDVKRTRAAAENSAKLVESSMAERDGLQAQLLAQQDANEQIGLSVTAIAALVSARLRDRAARKEADADIADTILGREQETAVLREQAQALRDLAASQTFGAAKAYSFDEQKKLWESIDQTAHDTFINIFDNGKSAFDRLRDTLKSGLLDLLYQMTVKKFVLNIGANVSGFSAIGGAANVAEAVSGADSAGNGAASLFNAASFAKTGYGLSASSGYIGEFANGYSGLASAASQAYGVPMTGTQTAGSYAGAAAPYLSAAAAGYSAYSVGEQHGAVAGVAAGAGTIAAGGAISGAAAGTGIAAGATAALAAIPVWGWVALAALAVFGSMQDGPESDTRLQFVSNNTPGNISINERGNQGQSDAYIGGYGTSAFGTFGVNSSFWMNTDQPVIQSFIKTVSATDDALATFLTATEKASVSSYLTGKTDTAHTGAEGSNPNASGQLDAIFADRINNILDGVSPGLSELEKGFSGTSQELAAEAVALLQYRAALKDAGAAVFGVQVTLEQVAALRNAGELTSAALSRVTNEFAVTNAAAVAMGKNASDAFGAIGLASTSAREQFILAAGGIDALGSKSNDFAQNYLTEAQRLAPITKSVSDAMAALGKSSITTRDAFRDELQAQDLNTEAGRTMAAALLDLEAQFALVHPPIEATTAALKSAADIASEHADLQKQLDVATMTSLQLLAQQRAALDSSNQSLFDQVQAAQAAKTAADAVASANASYQQQIDELLKAGMDATQVRALETAGMDASTIALYDRLAGLKASSQADLDAAKAAQTATKATADQRTTLQDQLDQATLTSVQLRDKERAAIDAGNLALYDQVTTAQAAQAAAKATADQRTTLQDQLDQATLTSVQLRDKERAAIDAGNLALYDQVQAAKDAKDALTAANGLAAGLVSGVTAAMNAVTQAVTEQKKTLAAAHDAEMTAAQTQLDNVATSMTKLRSLSDALHSTLSGMAAPGQEAADRLSAQAQIKAALAISRAGGPLPDAAGLQTALATVGKDAANQFSSFADYQRDFFSTASDISDLASLTDDQVSLAQKTFDQATAQKDLAEKTYDDEVARLDSLVTGAQAQVDALNGVNTSVLSVVDAIAALGSALHAAAANPIAAAPAKVADAYLQYLGRPAEAGAIDNAKTQVANGTSVDAIVDSIKNSNEAKLEALYHSILGRQGDAAGVQFWLDSLASGNSLSQISQAFYDSDEYKKLPRFAVGTNHVPSNMLAIVDEGERIIPAADNRALMARLASPDRGSQALAAEVRAWREEAATNRAILSEIAKHVRISSDVLDGATSGRPLLIEAV